MELDGATPPRVTPRFGGAVRFFMPFNLVVRPALCVSTSLRILSSWLHLWYKVESDASMC